MSSGFPATTAKCPLPIPLPQYKEAGAVTENAKEIQTTLAIRGTLAVLQCTGGSESFPTWWIGLSPQCRSTSPRSLAGAQRAGLGVPAAGHSALAGHSGAPACVPRLARRGGTPPGRPREPGSVASLSPLSPVDSGSPIAPRASVGRVGRCVRARGSAPRSPAATAAGTGKARRGRSRAGGSPCSADRPAVEDRSASWSTAPGTRRRRVLSRRLQVPSQSAARARWLPARLRARAARGGGTARGWGAGGRAGERASEGEEGGVSPLGMGKAGRGGGQSCPTLQTAPSPGRWPRSLPAANLTLPVRPQHEWEGWVFRDGSNRRL